MADDRLQATLAVVTAHFGVSVEALLGRRHTSVKLYKQARWCAIHLLRHDLGWGLGDIGKLFAGRDQSSINGYLRKPSRGGGAEGDLQMLRERIAARSKTVKRDQETNILSEVFALRIEVKALHAEVRALLNYFVKDTGPMGPR